MWHNRITENIQQTNSKPEEAEEKTGKRQAPSGGKRHRPGIATSKETARTNGNLRPTGQAQQRREEEVQHDNGKKSDQRRKRILLRADQIPPGGRLGTGGRMENNIRQQRPAKILAGEKRIRRHRMRRTIARLTNIDTNEWLDYGTVGSDCFVTYSSADGSAAEQKFDTLAAAVQRYTKLAGWILTGAYRDDARIQYLKTGTME
jgi:hypothetical protein